MAKYRVYDWMCRDCAHVFEETSDVADLDYQSEVMCPHCETRNCERLPNAAAGYQGNFGSASTRPKGAGSFARNKK